LSATGLLDLLTVEIDLALRANRLGKYTHSPIASAECRFQH
jgi:hypothetical protein